MKRVTLLMLGVLLSMVTLAQPGQNQKSRRGDGNGPNDGRRKVEMIERLNLSDDQQKQIEDFRTEFRATAQDYKNELDIKHAQLKAAVASDQLDRKKVDGLVKDISELNGKEFQLKINHRIEVRSVLDAKQKVMYDDMPFGKRGRGNRY